MMKLERLVFTSRVELTRAPQFTTITELDEERKDKLEHAFTKLELAIKNVGNSTFYGLIYQATLMFTAEDFYFPVLDSLSNYKPQSNNNKSNLKNK